MYAFFHCKLFCTKNNRNGVLERLARSSQGTSGFGHLSKELREKIGKRE